MLDPIKSLAELLRVALHVEFKTPAGKLNWGGLVLFFLLILALSVTDVFTVLMALVSKSAEANRPDIWHLILVFLGCWALCIVVLVLEQLSSAKNLGGKHRRDD